MKVLLVHNQYRSHSIGGEDVVFWQECRALKKQLGEHAVHTYTVSNDYIHKSKLLRTIWGDKTHAKAVASLVKQYDIDIVHVHNFFPVLTPSIFRAAKKAGARVVQTLHNYRWWCVPAILYHPTQGGCQKCVKSRFFMPAMLGRCYNNSFAQSVLGALALSWYRHRRVMDAVDRFWVLTPHQYDTLRDFGLPADRLYLKPNFVTIEAQPVSPEQKSGYLFVGRLDKAKGIDILLQSWQQSNVDATLTLIGMSEDFEALKAQYAAPNIRFIGKCSHAQTLRYMAQARFVCQLSLLPETFGLTIVEAMQQGTPVIGFNIGTRPHFITDNQTGFICAPADLTQTLQDSHQMSDTDYVRMSEAAAQKAAIYNEAEMMRQHLAGYTALMKDIA